MFLLETGACADDATLARMNATLAPRGPDDEGRRVEGPVGLAMRRLSVIDVGGGRQPMTNEDGTLWIVFNGEIYNYRELRSDLVVKGHVFRTRSDTEVILHLYEELGEKCVEKLNGMFAFCLWDSLRKRVFLARDRFGIKPLFYSFEPGKRLVFGSEMKALFQAGVSREPNWKGVYDYLSLMYVPTPATVYAAIFKLPPATTLTCSAQGVRIRQYWDLPLPDAGDEDIPGTQCEEEILALVEKAVKRQLVSDVQLGSLLSGGLDSTTVTAVMARKLGVPVKTFTIGFDRKSYDESAEAKLVADALGTDHTEEFVSPSSVESIPELFALFDEPFADYSAIPTFLVARLAAKDVKVVLTGDGGDEVFAGYPTHIAYKAANIARRIPRFLRARFLDPLVDSLPTSMARISFDYKAKKFVKGVDFSLERGHYWWKVIFDEREKAQLLTPEFLKIGFGDTFAAFERHFEACRRAHPLNRLLYVDAKTFLLDDNLVKVDRMTMANSLEARVPFLDHELAERVARLSPTVKTRGFQTKSLLRRAVRGLLPPSIRRGAKKGFTPPMPLWLGSELRAMVQSYFDETRIKKTGILNPKACARLPAEHLAGKKDNNREIWTILCLMWWLEANGLSPK
jgi:asparagine synthase (glutamine-hydrolysing)